ncbi:hypothetical protein [Cryptosporangium aurantiacum]|uniref:Uncharacterized protein n=1 Tax=Cryptosporangium aurantiacum TaxID=134849 RepID=A0A1M7QQR0_9ACTN|nr:hypothetical protein [Cryptosporangium aurantiacum]SHN33696.1 hypothetical protein SAMN05443668_105173 [Cryptosporangium aurantiacum]
MRNRWARVGVVVATLVVVNFAARLVLRIASGASEDVEFTTALSSLVAMGLVVAVAGFLTSRRYLPSVTAGDLFFDILFASLLVTLVGPFVSGGTPFGSGAGQWIIQLLVCVGALIVGGAIGVLLAVAFGLDPKSRAWGAYASQVKLPAKKAQPTKPGKRTQGAKKRPSAKR